MRIIITGGGTGGHTYPVLAVANEIRRRRNDAEILFIGTERGIEAKAAPAAGIPIKFINACGISLQPVEFIKFLINNSLGLFQALSVFNSFKPNFVLASGGFVSAPVVAAAALKGIPSILMESNVLPGKTNRLLSRWAKKVLVSFEESRKYLPKGKVIVTGNPIRKEIMERTREEGCKILNLSPEKFTLLITGASQGAKSINEAVLEALPQWDGQDRQIIHLVGRKNYEEVQKVAGEAVSDFNAEYRCIDYTEDMASVFAVADLVIARSGASTMSEITAKGIPAILIPYPFAADNHQEKNARLVEEHGGAVVIPDKEVKEKLKDRVISLAENKEVLRRMSDAMRSLGKPEALENIMRELEEFG